MADSMMAHAEHGRWASVGRCTVCSCGERLYQGQPPRASLTGNREAYVHEQQAVAAAFDAIRSEVQRQQAERSSHA